MKVKLEYGLEGLEVELPDRNTTVVEPAFVAGVANEREEMVQALRSPIGSRPLAELVRPTDTVAIVVPDITRPCPTDRMLPPLLEELSYVPHKQVTIIVGTGGHRANNPDELRRMLGPEAVNNYRVVNHDARDDSSLAFVGTTRRGIEVFLNKEYLRADKKILVGFIEPHIFAGFSGGGKGVLPSVAGQRTILRHHSGPMLANPNATYGISQGNPAFEEIREAALMTNPTFLLNTSLNKKRETTGIFYGDLVAAHDKGIAFCRKTALREVPHRYDIVITTNGGYPLDLNLYQAIKGMTAAARIVKDGGAIIEASECCEGLPDHGRYPELLHMFDTPRAAWDAVCRPEFCIFDQWEIQLQAAVQMRADVYFYSTIPDAEVRAAMGLEPIHSVEETVEKLLRKYGKDASICVLPQGPFTIPYIADAAEWQGAKT
ncbi:MAG TPA: nickel-dependent lactate racemase [Thermoleophilia bacterium]|nr:nickel-dependent lactate racemase [Thermoleophilia bacterium]